MKKQPLSQSAFNRGLMEFIQASPTPFHAAQQIAGRLEKSGYQRLFESDPWHLQKGSCYYVVRNDSSVIAFMMGQASPSDTGLRMVGTHTDSPCLKVKPCPERISNSFLQLGVEVYGGALLNPWFDRDLSLAGRVTCLTRDKTAGSFLVDFERPLAVISSLAIHLDRDANKKRKINAQTDLPPVILQVPDAQGNAPEPYDFKDLLLQQVRKQYPECDAESVLAHEICLYDTHSPAFIGLNNDFIAAARLDNLASCYTGLMSLLNTPLDQDVSCFLICNDHEEVGSVSTTGALGPFLKTLLKRFAPHSENLFRAIDQSLLISADNAHGVHPNYADKFEPNHSPILNQGPVIKINANQRYASNSETVAAFHLLCTKADVPVQEFVVRSDMACGSTIGPLTAGVVGVKTVDIGIPTFSMHSIRELAGSRDGYYLYKALRKFYTMPDIAGAPAIGGTVR